ncbi:MAG: DEAD/DEAH box helicase [Leptospiraceae bacterium]|nr:DEAD/DEAH box helicase [Leptospiraceae bacterium]
MFSYSGVFHPYIHQKKAWDRILKKQHSIITTGTGSGKTECFLYPVLEKALEKKQKGKKGISTVILYPMNALATDQEKRFAKVIYNTPELKNADIRVGTFIGRQEKKKGRRIMEENAAITDHETLLANPPDILLTNYKMLDFLLMRPSDSRLWKNNEEGTLEYLILDELHTYDGAQGTDVACLIRRLKDRLKCKQGSFCFVGTSATIDSGEKKNYSGRTISDTEETSETPEKKLAEFASLLSGEEIGRDSIIGEERLEKEELLPISPSIFLDPGNYDYSPYSEENREEYCKRQANIWGSPSEPVLLGEWITQTDLYNIILTAYNREKQNGNTPLLWEEFVLILQNDFQSFRLLDKSNIESILLSFLSFVHFARRFFGDEKCLYFRFKHKFGFES